MLNYSIHTLYTGSNYFKRVMNGCDALLVIIGNNNHNSPWINREVELGISKNLPIVVTQLPNTTGGIPNKLRGMRYREVDWDDVDLAYELSML
ncbi:MAG: TIR domain-containing protein [Algicola sp.]|nr:TIR domain-containing protein [Algicola sp.]